MHNEMVTPAAAEVLTLMLMAAEKLPDTWETDGFWLGGAQYLAQFIADYEEEIESARLAMLLSIGGQMLVMASREREANPEAVVGDWTAAFGKGGVA